MQTHYTRCFLRFLNLSGIFISLIIYSSNISPVVLADQNAESELLNLLPDDKLEETAKQGGNTVEIKFEVPASLKNGLEKSQAALTQASKTTQNQLASFSKEFLEQGSQNIFLRIDGSVLSSDKGKYINSKPFSRSLHNYHVAHNKQQKITVGVESVSQNSETNILGTGTNILGRKTVSAFISAKQHNYLLEAPWQILPFFGSLPTHKADLRLTKLHKLSKFYRVSVGAECGYIFENLKLNDFEFSMGGALGLDYSNRKRDYTDDVAPLSFLGRLFVFLGLNYQLGLSFNTPVPFGKVKASQPMPNDMFLIRTFKARMNASEYPISRPAKALQGSQISISLQRNNINKLQNAI